MVGGFRLSTGNRPPFALCFESPSLLRNEPLQPISAPRDSLATSLETCVSRRLTPPTSPPPRLNETRALSRARIAKHWHLASYCKLRETLKATGALGLRRAPPRTSHHAFQRSLSSASGSEPICPRFRELYSAKSSDFTLTTAKVSMPPKPGMSSPSSPKRDAPSGRRAPRSAASPP